MSAPDTSPEAAPPKASVDEPSPLMGDWNKVYFAVLVELVVTVGLLYALTRWAS